MNIKGNSEEIKREINSSKYQQEFTLAISVGPFIGLCMTLHLPPPLIIIVILDIISYIL